MISHRKNGDERTHDNLRADIARDLFLGGDPTNAGRGLIDMKVSMSTLAGLDDMAAEIPGMGPVIADVARKFADLHPRADWQATITDDSGNVVDVVTTSRRPTKAISRLVNATQPTCSFPGCRAPAADCDFEHLIPANQRGETSTRNGGPKCRHDHILKDQMDSHEGDGCRHLDQPTGPHLHRCRSIPLALRGHTGTPRGGSAIDAHEPGGGVPGTEKSFVCNL